mgnify:CR=1 FL=1
MEDLNLTIAKMVHEIRNPLTLINSSLQLIETTHPEVKDFQFWSQTLEDVEYLNQLLDDLAVYSDDRRFFMCEADLKEIILSLEESPISWPTGRISPSICRPSFRRSSEIPSSCARHS